MSRARGRTGPAGWSDDGPWAPAALRAVVPEGDGPWPARDAELAWYWLHTALSGPAIARRLRVGKGAPASRAARLGLPARPHPLMLPTGPGGGLPPDVVTQLPASDAGRDPAMPLGSSLRARRALPLRGRDGMVSTAALFERAVGAETASARVRWRDVVQWALAQQVDVVGCETRAEELAAVNAARRAVGLPPFACAVRP